MDSEFSESDFAESDASYERERNRSANTVRLAKRYAMEITDKKTYDEKLRHFVESIQLLKETHSEDAPMDNILRQDLLRLMQHQDALALFDLARAQAVAHDGWDENNFDPPLTVKAIDSLIELAFKNWKRVKPDDAELLDPTSYRQRLKEWGKKGAKEEKPDKTEDELEEERLRIIAMQHRYEKDFASEQETALALRVLKLLEPQFKSTVSGKAGRTPGSNILFFRSLEGGPGTAWGISL